MTPLFLAAATAVWLGILTSISPCPLATNIAAVSYIGKQMSTNRAVFFSGLSYSLGRMIAYIGISLVLIAGLLSVPNISFFLQNHLNKLLGPVLLAAGILLLDILPLSLPNMLSPDRSSDKYKKLANAGMIVGPGLLGILFALSFCPVSAALFFGSLIPLSLTHQSAVFLPALYGLGTGLPVLIFAALFAFSARSLGAALNALAGFERWARRLTGIIFILVGGYYVFIYLVTPLFY